MQSQHPQIGQIAAFIGPFQPLGWLFCDGRLMEIANRDFDMLFAVIGTKYGGDGQETFALPTLAGPIPGVRPVIAYAGTFPQPDQAPSPPVLRGFAVEWSGPLPEDYVPATGQIYKISDNTPLFGLLGTQFGGDNKAGTFALPNLGGNWIINTTGTFPLKS